MKEKWEDKRMSGKKIIIAGGGTGGHIFPAIAIANAIKELQPQTEILFVGAKGKMEMEKVPQAGYKITGLDIAGYERSSLIKNIWLPFKLVKSFSQEKILITGNPVRKSIAESKVSKEEALDFFGLERGKPTVLIFGGSLGARSINEVIAQHILDFNPLNLQLIWQTGKVTANAYLERAKPLNNVWANDFINEMDKSYAAADIVVSRAGAMAVAELCVAKKPVIFVPFPFAAEDHQTMNAKYLVDRDAALMVKDEMVKARLFTEITTLAKDTSKQKELENNIAAFAVKNADKKIAEEILKSIGE